MRYSRSPAMSNKGFEQKSCILLSGNGFLDLTDPNINGCDERSRKRDLYIVHVGRVLKTQAEFESIL